MFDPCRKLIRRDRELEDIAEYANLIKDDRWVSQAGTEPWEDSARGVAEKAQGRVD